MSVAQKTQALVVGAFGDIGVAIADDFEAAGLEVTRVGRPQFDLAKPASIDAYFEGDQRAYRVLCYAAGINKPKAFDELSLDEVRHTFEVNVMGFLHVMKRLAPRWADGQGARVVALSSLYGFLARGKRVPYVTSKHGLLGAVKTLAIEYGPRGVLINALSPGYVDTKMTRANNDAATIRGFEQGIPLGRLASPKDIAQVVTFLCSPQNTYLTGQDIVVDGGFSVGGFQR